MRLSRPLVFFFLILNSVLFAVNGYAIVKQESMRKDLFKSLRECHDMVEWHSDQLRISSELIHQVK